jgi:hypothetical protein
MLEIPSQRDKTMPFGGIVLWHNQRNQPGMALVVREFVWPTRIATLVDTASQPPIVLRVTTSETQCVLAVTRDTLTSAARL